MDILQKKDHVPEQLVYLDLAFSLFSTQAQPGASAGLSAISTVRTLPLLVRSGHTTGATMNGGSFPAQSIREGYHLGGVAPEALRGGARVDQGYAVTLCLILLPLRMVSTLDLVSNVVEVVDCGRCHCFLVQFRYGDACWSASRVAGVDNLQQIILRMIFQTKNNSDSKIQFEHDIEIL